MITRAHRLHQRRDLQRLTKRGRSISGALAFLKIVRTEPTMPLRCTVVASAKVSKKAVIRNRLKRQIRALLAKYVPTLPPGYDVAVYLRAAAVGATSAELRAALEKLFSAARLR